MTHLRLWRWSLALLILVGLGWQLAVHAPDDWSALATPALSPLALAAVAATASYVAMATAWARLRNRGESWVDVGGAWFASLLARYVPGGIWQGAVRATEGHARGERLSDNVAAFLSEQALACFSAASLALLSLVAGPSMPAWLVTGLAAVGAIAVGASFVLARIASHPTWPMKAVGWTLLGHGLIAASFAAFVASFAPGDSVDLLVSARAFLVAGLASVLVVFVPAGLGVREGVLAWMLAPRLGVGMALAVALMARIGLLGCELAAWGIWAAARRRGRQP